MSDQQAPDVASRDAAVLQSMESAFAALQNPQQPAPQPVPPAVSPAPSPEPVPPAASPAPSPEPVPPATPEPPTLPADGPTTEAQLKSMFSDPAPDAAPEEPKAELPPDAPIAPPEGLDERAGNAWAQLRSRERQVRQFAEEQKRTIEELRKRQEQVDRERSQLADALKAKDDELKAQREKAGKFDLSASTEFRQRYDQPLQQAEANLDAVLVDGIVGTDTPEGLARVRRSVMSDDATFRRYISELDEGLQDRIRSKRQALLETQAEREAALKDWETTSRGLSRTAAAESVADKLLARQRLAEAAEQFNLQATPVSQRPLVLTDSFFADDVATANKAFKDFMQTATDEQIARAAHMGHLVPTMQRALVYALNQARQYQEAYYAVRGIAKPGSFATSGAAPAVPAPPKPVAQDVSPVEAKENAIADSIRGILTGAPPVGGQG